MTDVLDARATGRDGAFADPNRIARSWYVLARSGDVRAGRPRTVELLGRRIVLVRDGSGTAHAFDARCVHLGADLGQGRMVDDQLECPFHQWRFSLDGRCSHAPGHAVPPARSIRRWPVVERWGLTWVFAGREPTFQLPDVSGRRRVLRPPSQQIGCHPHLVLGNVFDLTHFGPLHDIDLVEEPLIERRGEHELAGVVCARFRSRRARVVTGTAGGPIRATFRLLGGSVLHARIDEPFGFDVIFTGRPSDDGGCTTRTVFLLPRSPRRAMQGVLLVLNLLHDDRRIMDRLQFAPAFTEVDSGLRELQRFCDAQPTAWTRPARLQG